MEQKGELKQLELQTIYDDYCVKKEIFPLYTATLLNLACNTFQANRRSNVGFVSELFQAYKQTEITPTCETWKTYYKNAVPDGVERCAEKTWEGVQKFRKALESLKKEDCTRYANDLLINKTFEGLAIQEAILDAIAAENGTVHSKHVLAEDEQVGIDGYIGDLPVSIKPESYKQSLSKDTIEAPIVFYKKAERKHKIVIQYNDAALNNLRKEN